MESRDMRSIPPPLCTHMPAGWVIQSRHDESGKCVVNVRGGGCANIYVGTGQTYADAVTDALALAKSSGERLVYVWQGPDLGLGMEKAYWRELHRREAAEKTLPGENR